MSETYSSIERAYFTASLQLDNVVRLLADTRQSLSDLTDPEYIQAIHFRIAQFEASEADLRATLAILEPQFKKLAAARRKQK